MPLTEETKHRLKTAVTSAAAADEIESLIDSGDNPIAANVAAIGTTANLTALVPAASAIEPTASAIEPTPSAIEPAATTFSAAACAGGATPSATDVNAAIDAATAEAKTALDLKADNADVNAALDLKADNADVNAALDLKADNADVNAALDLKADNADVETLRTENEARHDALEAKVDAILAALKAAGGMVAD